MGKEIERTILEMEGNHDHSRFYIYVVSHLSDETYWMEIHTGWDNVVSLNLELAKELQKRLPEAIKYLEKYNAKEN